MNEPLIVWVAEQGIYSERGVIGVYASVEGAMADLTKNGKRYEWREHGGAYYNGLDWEEHISLTRYQVQP